MSIDSLTLGEIKQIVATFSAVAPAAPSRPPDGFGIAVLDRGFVYAGRIEVDGDWCVIREARNVRYWGTTDGLGQLALSGPTEKTKLDRAGTVRAPLRSVISILETREELWKKS